jgi:hypothetical protein
MVTLPVEAYEARSQLSSVVSWWESESVSWGG